MPIANVIRIMRRILPPHAKISDDAKETIQECVSEYISFITREANDRCQREQRKTITAEDVLWAMGKLGFDEYVEPLSLFLSKYRESENERNSSVRDPILRRSGVTVADYGNFPMPPFVPGLHMGQHVPGMGMGMGFFDPSMYGGYYRNAFDGAGGGGSGSGSGGAGGSSGGGAGGSSYSSNPQINYDPFAQYK
uniref:Leafy-cotyledon protein 1 n=1 Tax=Jatropha curcas TaxID=180498 RepID=A0A0A7CBX9_JATCU|nr:leafy-cotyledon protein 1 [Jatropha curcas]